MNDPCDEPLDPWWLIALGIAVVLTIALGGAWLYQHLPPA